MIESFPLGLIRDSLAADDFQTLAGAFAAIISRAIVGHPRILFPTSAAELTADRLSGRGAQAGQAADLYRQLMRGEKTGALCHNMLLLALPLADGGRQIVVADQLDATVAKLAADDWLAELAARLPAELAVAKRLWLDAETNLPNTACLLADLAACGAETATDNGDWLLFLAETPTAASSRDGFAQAIAAAAALRAFCGGARLFHLGQCVFAVLAASAIWKRSPSDLVWYLKNEGFRRARVGAACLSGRQTTRNAEDAPAADASLLDRAWTALREARRRGPFGFCDFAALALAPTPTRWRRAKSIQAVLQASRTFAVTAISGGGAEQGEKIAMFLTERFMNIAGFVIDFRGRDIYLFVADKVDDPAQWRSWAECVLADIKRGLPGSRLHAGVAIFPNHGGNLGLLLENARKALTHATFYQPGSVALFDALSCHVAGDAHFAAGDLPKAMREYRAGLAIEPENANLLNSLGVTLAMLDKNEAATRLFQQAVAADPENYMALCNLGFVAQSRHHLDEAMDFFAKALRLTDGKSEHRRLARELRFYLGRLRCRVGSYAEALDLLLAWQKSGDDLSAPDTQVGDGREAWPYLGKAWAALGETRRAVTALQRAVAINPGDHESMGLLGELILRAGEGDDIAKALCRKSVELEPSSMLNRLRLAEAECRLGEWRAALTHCPRPGQRGDATINARIAGLLSDIYQQLGQTRHAERWAARAGEIRKTPDI
ncbi:MAG: tetratricopeptide repeat protein [Desulfobulbaceae bacterium]|nr:tetratricopeptide repeat protein [Desulfobulbaceae bacterium]